MNRVDTGEGIQAAKLSFVCYAQRDSSQLCIWSTHELVRRIKLHPDLRVDNAVTRFHILTFGLPSFPNS
jgi:hypothetical protein